MGAEDASRSHGPVALSALFEEALSQLKPASGPMTLGDGFLYSGNRHETVPRALFLDRRLTPLERNAWQVFRLRLSDDGLTAFPTYEELRPYLASMPCAAQASHETVARALTLLRLTRWLSLVRRRRDAKTGCIQGNLYVLHDEPLTPFEAMQLDPDYLGLVSHALTHAAKAVQLVGLRVLREIVEDPLLSGRTLPTRLQALALRMTRYHESNGSYPQSDAHESEEGADALLRNAGLPSSESEDGAQTAPDGGLRIPNKDRTVRKSRINEVRTVPRANALQNLRLPDRLLHLKEEQQAGALMALQQVDESQRQAVLDEWAARCGNSTVRNPAGYLFGIIQKAIRGEFKAWAGAGAPASSTPRPAASAATSTPAARRPVDPEVVRAHLERIRATLRDR